MCVWWWGPHDHHPRWLSMGQGGGGSVYRCNHTHGTEENPKIQQSIIFSPKKIVLIPVGHLISLRTC